MPHTLLLADDSVTIQRVIELTFADEDIRVIAVGDGQQAIDRVTAEPPDIVLADTGMPEHDGYEVATFIKSDLNLAHIPVVLLTGAFEPVDEDRATKAGFAAVLVKPFEPQEVIRRVRELLGHAAAPVAAVGTAEVDGGHAVEENVASGLPAGFEPRSRLVTDVDPDETRATPRLVPNESTETRTSPDDADPVSVYLDRVDAALDLLDNDRRSADEPTALADAAVAPQADPDGPPVGEGSAPQPASEPAEDPADLDSLEGALSALEGALESLSLEPTPPVEEDAASTSEAIAEPVEELLAPVFAPVADSIGDSTGEPEPAAAEELAAELEMIEKTDPTSGPDASPDVATTPPPVAESPTVADGAGAPAPVLPAQPPVAADWAGPAPTPTAPTPAPPTLADAFASLLAAEQGAPAQPRAPHAWPVSPRTAGPPDGDLVERVTDRVLARLSDTVTTELVTQIVTQVAERLVRAELDRQKP